MELLPLQIQFYFQIFDDITDIARRIAPLEYPSLVNGIEFPPAVRLKSISTGSNKNLNFIPIGQSISGPDYEIRLSTNDQDIILLIKPFERKVKIEYLNNA